MNDFRRKWRHDACIFQKKMDNIFSMIGIVCPALIKSRKPADVRVFFRNFRCVALKWYSASR
ncbi:hypothetical protein FEK99_04990 [Escherichia coli]|nr:hypothetical protein [Escherichia coli]QFW16383.1 hypothetical protein FEK99_04990 [Escherichia coli]